jgi:hypothetical protein
MSENKNIPITNYLALIDDNQKAVEKWILDKFPKYKHIEFKPVGHMLRLDMRYKMSRRGYGDNFAHVMVDNILFSDTCMLAGYGTDFIAFLLTLERTRKIKEALTKSLFLYVPDIPSNASFWFYTFVLLLALSGVPHHTAPLHQTYGSSH